CIGRGYLSNSDLDAVGNTCSAIRGQEPDAILLVALHHVPCRVPSKEYGRMAAVSNAIAYLDLRLKNHARARNRLGQDGDLVLFGHLHRTFYRLAACARWSRRAALAPAPALSQLGEPVVGFNVYLLLCVN